ncbi:zinc finger and SCAN domain-containing protein 12-like [Drosophila subpulchrella]|uniref:zinc finger and SCAN domain-containing protein 12-like n=1 Tax=Drosophila subpulchrella TaxID=1486046 RepID=UPI0018A12F88|nr:zinc finger and SCAN domain-containing protein 12-like [Drosophila subpulchrella]
MESSICRVCLEDGDDLVNIFEGTHQLEVSLADMISEWAGYKIERGDTFPETICPTCLQDAQNAYEMKPTYRRGHQLKEDPLEHLLKDEVYKEPDIECRITNNTEDSHPCVAKIKEEDIEEPLGNHFQSQERDEPPKEEVFEEEYNPISECKIKVVEDDKLREMEDQCQISQEPLVEEFKDEHPITEFETKVLEDDNLREMEEPLEEVFEKEYNPISECETNSVEDDNLQDMEDPLGDRFKEVFEEEYNPLSENDIKVVEDAIQENENNIIEVDWEAFNNDGKINSIHKCSYCSMIFISKSALTVHCQKHIGELPWKCTICSMAFENSIYLQRHVKRHEETLPFKCNHCLFTFRSRLALNSHLRIHKEKQQCIHCLEIFPLISELKRHLGHNYEEQKLKCTYCTQAYACNTLLQQHMKTHTEIMPIECPRCPKILQGRSALQNHLRIHVDRTFKCSPCAQTFPNVEALNLHLRNHSLERPFKCFQCSRTFATSRGVQLHERTHTGQHRLTIRQNTA